jgi:hypothetical protein
MGLNEPYKFTIMPKRRKSFNKNSFHAELNKITDKLETFSSSETTLTAEYDCTVPTQEAIKAMKNFIAAADKAAYWDRKCSKYLIRLVMQDGPDYSGWLWLIPLAFILLVLAMYLVR